MVQVVLPRSEDLLRQLENLLHTAEDPCLIAWLQRELEGYDKYDELPWYRIMKCRQRGLFMADNSSHQHTSQIDENSLCKQDIEKIRFMMVRGPLADYIGCCHTPTLERWPDALLLEYSRSLIPHNTCLYAWKEPIESIKTSLMKGICSVLKQYVPSMSHDMEHPNRSLRSLQHRQWWI